jgi:hypothetical protein
MVSSRMPQTQAISVLGTVVARKAPTMMNMTAAIIFFMAV